MCIIISISALNTMLIAMLHILCHITSYVTFLGIRPKVNYISQTFMFNIIYV